MSSHVVYFKIIKISLAYFNRILKNIRINYLCWRSKKFKNKFSRNIKGNSYANMLLIPLNNLSIRGFHKINDILDWNAIMMMVFPTILLLLKRFELKTTLKALILTSFLTQIMSLDFYLQELINHFRKCSELVMEKLSIKVAPRFLSLNIVIILRHRIYF